MSKRQSRFVKPEVKTEQDRRTMMVADSLKLVMVSRTYGLRKAYNFIADQLVEKVMILSDCKEDELQMIFGRGRQGAVHIDLEKCHRKDVGPHTISFTRKQRIEEGHTDNFYKRVARVIEDHKDEKENPEFKPGRHKISRMVKDIMPETMKPEVFHHMHESFSISMLEQPHEHGPWLRKMMEGTEAKEVYRAKRLVKTLLNIHLYDNSGDTYIDKQIMYKRIMEQIFSFVETGGTGFDKYTLVHPGLMKSYPTPYIDLDDGEYSLVWKHGKYCEHCGALMDGCWCTPVYEDEDGKIEQANGECWACIKKHCVEVITQKKKASDVAKKTCREYMDYFWDTLSDWHDTQEFTDQFSEFIKLHPGEDEGDPPKPTLKPMTEEKAMLFIEAVNDYYIEGYDGDGPDDMCSCPVD